MLQKNIPKKHLSTEYNQSFTFCQPFRFVVSYSLSKVALWFCGFLLWFSWTQWVLLFTAVFLIKSWLVNRKIILSEKLGILCKCLLHGETQNGQDYFNTPWFRWICDMITRAARKLQNHVNREYRDFWSSPWSCVTAVIIGGLCTKWAPWLRKKNSFNTTVPTLMANRWRVLYSQCWHCCKQFDCLIRSSLSANIHGLTVT